MDARVFAQFGVEGGGHDFALTDEDGVTVTLGEDFDAGPGAFDARGAEVDLLEWLGA